MFQDLTAAEIAKVKKIFEGYKIRRAVKRACAEFTQIVKRLEGPSTALKWSPHGIRCSVIATATPSRQAKLRQLRLKREQYANQLKVINRKISQRQAQLANKKPS